MPATAPAAPPIPRARAHLPSAVRRGLAVVFEEREGPVGARVDSDLRCKSQARTRSKSKWACAKRQSEYRLKKEEDKTFEEKS
eukprot:2468284-Pleurochrysis_carterae.AAC.2